jgi:hypothetical protein
MQARTQSALSLTLLQQTRTSTHTYNHCTHIHTHTCTHTCNYVHTRYTHIHIHIHAATHAQTLHTHRIGHNHIPKYGVDTVFWQENHQIYGPIRCLNTVVANPAHYTCTCLQCRRCGESSWSKPRIQWPRSLLLRCVSIPHAVPPYSVMNHKLHHSSDRHTVTLVLGLSIGSQVTVFLGRRTLYIYSSDVNSLCFWV